jgi:NAD-dependent dihydropyrimidine dehydrogenase PreA subunit
MAYIITDDCINCGVCVSECPTDCIAEGDSKYVINGPDCIDCGAWAGVCPVDACVAE